MTTVSIHIDAENAIAEILDGDDFDGAEAFVNGFHTAVERMNSVRRRYVFSNVTDAMDPSEIVAAVTEDEDGTPIEPSYAEDLLRLLAKKLGRTLASNAAPAPEAPAHPFVATDGSLLCGGLAWKQLDPSTRGEALTAAPDGWRLATLGEWMAHGEALWSRHRDRLRSVALYAWIADTTPVAVAGDIIRVPMWSVTSAEAINGNASAQGSVFVVKEVA